MRRGYNIFLTGPPGSGKSYVLSAFVNWASKRKIRVALTASTGIAASLLGGTTIHSWSGMGMNHQINIAKAEELATNQLLSERLNNVDILIIDEISMLSGQMLDSLNLLLRVARRSKEPFGGIQVIFCGDFFQLPPIKTEADDYAFNSGAWISAEPLACYLSEQHRQGGDELTDILLALRSRSLNRRHLELLMARSGIEHNPVTMLMTHNRYVDATNSLHLSQIKGEVKTYQAVGFGDTDAVGSLSRSILAPAALELKVGAEVMFVANDSARGFVNGSQGKVVRFKRGKPVVRLKSGGNRLVVEEHIWKSEIEGKTVAKIAQLPLRLAWAITIHKSQGMSLDAAEINLRHSFTFGMGYVALSRLKSYEGLYLSGLNSRALQLNRAVFPFDEAMLRQSRMNERLLKKALGLNNR